MRNELGVFEGKEVKAGSLKLAGSVADRVGHLDYGEEVFFVGKASVAAITHGDLKALFTRQHTGQVAVLLLMDRENGERMLAEGEALANERFGIQQLFEEADGVLKNPDDPPPPDGEGPASE